MSINLNAVNAVVSGRLELAQIGSNLSVERKGLGLIVRYHGAQIAAMNESSGKLILDNRGMLNGGMRMALENSLRCFGLRGQVRLAKSGEFSVLVGVSWIKTQGKEITMSGLKRSCKDLNPDLWKRFMDRRKELKREPIDPAFEKIWTVGAVNGWMSLNQTKKIA